MQHLYPLLLFASLVAAATPDVYYYTLHGYDSSEALDVSSNGAKVMLRKWDQTLRIFDSTTDVVVTRLDVAGTPGSVAALYPSPSVLSIEGAAYIFAQNVNYTLTDTSAGTVRQVATTDAVVWMSAGACIRLSVTLNSTGGASLTFVSSGSIDWKRNSGSQSCTTLNSLVGEEMAVNYVKYTLTNNASCTDPLEHGDDYSNLDEPIRSLPAHYHTRGSLYYPLYGKGQFNDNGTKYEGQYLYGGELRFVNVGFYYGPEVLEQPPLSYVTSTHEVDPSKVQPKEDTLFPPSGKDQCPFACMQKPGSGGASLCTLK